MPPAPRYQPLDSSSKQIRLLKLLPFDENQGPPPPWFKLANIQCKLIYANLDSFPEYEALSYTWGSSGSDVKIEVDGQAIFVRANLACALAALRNSKTRILWVDALCINQDDIEERNHQVGHMGEIYRRSRQVLAWLGRPSEGFGSVVTSAVWFAERLGEFPPTSVLPPAPKLDPGDEPPQVYSREIVEQQQDLYRKWKEWLELKQWHELEERQALEERLELEEQRLEERQLEKQELGEQRLEEQRLEKQRQEIGQRYQELRQLLYMLERKLEQEKWEQAEKRQKLKAERQRKVEEWQEMKLAESLKWQEQVVDRKTSGIWHSWTDYLLCLASICDLPYWSRLWIVPEVLLAAKVIICFGDDERTTRDWDIWTKARHSLERIPDVWDLPPIVVRSITLIKQSLLFQLDKQRQHRDQGWPLHTLLVMTERSLCEDPRDKIYGLLGLANDIRIEDLDIDYSKPLYEAYQDAMRWYSNCHRGRQEGFPSLVRFSQIVQMSLKGHSVPQAVDGHPNLALLDTIPLRKPLEMFHTTAVSKGSVLPMERILDDNELMDLRRRDWLYTTTECLHNSRGQQSKNALENELKYLDSINTTWAIPYASSAYAMADGDTLQPEDRGTNQPVREAGRKIKENTQFFIAACGKFGLASSCIREDDILCEFKGCDTGVILRRKGGYYILVSKAILSSGSAGASVGLVKQPKTPSEPTAEPTPKDELIIDVVLDAATLQGLTRPFDLTDKHRYREPLSIQESSFGWYEFMKYGITVDRYQHRYISQPNTIIQTRSLWKVLSSKWMLLWTQPLQRLWLLVRIFSYLNNALKSGRNTLQSAAFGHLWVHLSPLRYLNTLPKMGVTTRPKRLTIAATG